MSRTTRQVRRAAIAMPVLLAGLALWCGCQLPEVPSQDASGELRLVLDPDLEPPITHAPVEYWRTHHREAINRGEFPEADCQRCHEPDTYCNNCHNYVGVIQIETVAGARTLASTAGEEVAKSGD